MRKAGAIAATMATLAAVLCSVSPSAALTFRFGPFYFHFPYYYGYWHWHRHHAARHPRVQTAHLGEEGNANAAPAAAPAAAVPASEAHGGLTSALLYPAAALPAIYDEMFWPPASSPWPFSYRAIFETAFAKAAPDQAAPKAAPEAASMCQHSDRAGAVVDRIEKDVKPTADQEPQLQKLRGALAIASDSLAKACPSDIPALPVPRLQLMEWQVEKLAQSLDIVRQPLQDFERSLTDGQRAQFATGLPTPAAAMHADRASTMVSACAVTPTTVDWSIERIALTVQPTDAQRDAVTNLRQAFGGAASELDKNCPLSLPRSPVARLEAIEARLDATWRAEVAIEVALTTFQSALNDEQKARFEQMDFATAQQ